MSLSCPLGARRLAAAFAALVFTGALLLSGCGRRESMADSAAREGRFRMVLAGDPQSLDPHVATDVPGAQVFLALFEGLAAYDPVTCEPRPGAAERWDISPDGRVYTFRLRPAGRWSNGDPVTAGDFVYGVRRLLAPALGSEYSYFGYCIRNGRAFNQGKITDASALGVRAIDDRTLEFVLEQPTAYFLALLCHFAYSPVHRASLEQHGPPTSRATPWARPGRIVGNGPFVLEKWESGQRLVVTKNSFYREAAKVRLNAIEFLPMENSDTADRSFRAGQVHVTDELPLPRVSVYRQEKNPQFVSATYLDTDFLTFNTRQPPFNDARVRRAFSLAIDRQLLVERVTRRGEVAARSLTPPGTAGFQPPLGPLHDGDAARRLLREAGFASGAALPPIELIFPTNDSARTILEALQGMWQRELGVTVRVTNVEWKVFLDTLSRKDYQIGFMAWIGDYVDPNTYISLLHSDNGNNRTGWASPAYDDLVDRADRALERTERYRLMAEAETILTAEVPLAPIYHRNRSFLLHSAVRGFTPNLLDMHPYDQIWFEPKAR